jgi:O-antigen/teichoic acid export membrane protein
MGTITNTESIKWEGQSLTRKGRSGWSAATTTRQGVHSLLDQGVVSATNFLTGVIIARACSKDELGLYMLGFSLFLFLVDLQTSLIATPYMIYAPRLQGSARALYMGSTLIHQLVLCFFTMLGLVVGAVVVTHGVGPKGLGQVLWAMVAVVWAIMLREYARRVFFASLKAKQALIFDSCIAIAQISGLILMAHLHLLSASRAYWISGCACGLAFMGWLWSQRSFYQLRINDAIVGFKKNWTFGRWALGSGFIWTISMNFYPWLLAAFYGTASAGVLAACLGTVALGNPAVLGVQNFLGPKIAHVYALEGATGLRRFVFRASIAFAVPIMLFCVVMMMRGGPVVALLYGHGYLGNGLVVSILTWNLAVTAVASSFSRALFAIERADVDFLVNFIALFMMLALGLWLVRSFGVVGTAIALLIANTATSAAKGFALQILTRESNERQVA